MSPPRKPGCHELADQAVFYADGCLSGPELSAFEQALGESAELREVVAGAREVRRLVCGLPRKHSALPPLEELLERIDARPSPGLRASLDRLPRKPVPADLLERIQERIQEQLFEPRAGGGRVLRRRVWRSLVASAVAAAALLVVAVRLHGERDTIVVHPPKHARLAHVRFEPSIVRYEPGFPLRGAPEAPSAIDGRTYLPRPQGADGRVRRGRR